LLKTAYLILFLFSLLGFIPARAQSADALIRQGNRNYNKQEYDQSLLNYDKALKKSPGNPDAQFNQGDALYRKSDYEKAAAAYDDVLQSKADDKTRQSAYYNKGVADIRQKKLEESIDAWKNALRLNPTDSDARENLVKALLEKKKQDQQQQQQNKKDQKEKKPKEDKQKQDQNQDNKPRPQQSKLTKQQVEQYLRSLEQREKDVQDKMNQNKNHSLSQPDKDW
jgi:tetratricopeptide (TPR) repeat protein